MALAVRCQRIAFPHTEFNGDRTKKRYYVSIPLYLPLCRPLWLLLFIPLFLPCERALAVRCQKLHFHIQNLTVINPKTIYYCFIPLYLPLCRPLWLPWLLSLFLPCERALAVRKQKIAFPHTEFNGDRAKQKILFFHSFIFSFMSPLMTPFIYPLTSSCQKALAVRGQKFAFPHIEFNGDRAKQKWIFFHSFISSLMSPLMTPFISPLISSLGNGLGRQRPTICISTYRI